MKLTKIVAIFRSLNQGMKSSTADYWVLKEVSSLPGYGEELFQTQLLCGSPGPALGVGPHGITIYSTKKQVKDRYISSNARHIQKTKIKTKKYAF